MALNCNYDRNTTCEYANPMISSNRLLIRIVVLAAVLGSANAGAEEKTSRTNAVARPFALYTAEGKPERLDFDFGNIKAWIRNKGGWNVEGPIKHVGLLCATYEIGLRFGVGSPGCDNVKWISDVSYGTREQQCNSAAVQHYGGGFLPDLAKDFDRITCAERVIRCSGNCE